MIAASRDLGCTTRGRGHNRIRLQPRLDGRRYGRLAWGNGVSRRRGQDATGKADALDIGLGRAERVFIEDTKR